MFLKLLDVMVTRDFHSQFDGQQIMNIAMTKRIQRDEDLQTFLTDRLSTAVHPSVTGSNARHLAAVRRLMAKGGPTRGRPSPAPSTGGAFRSPATTP